MSLDLDPTEQQLAAALSRIADAHVPVASDPPVVSLDSRRRHWLTLAVAASLVALVAGIWAVASRDADRSVVTVPPQPAPTTPDTATPDTATPDSTTPDSTTPVTASAEPAPPTPEGTIAIIDPAVAPAAPQTPGVIDRHLRWTDAYELQATRAVRRGADGRPDATISAWLLADRPGGASDRTIGGWPALRAEGEAFGAVTYLIDLPGGTLGVMTQPSVEDEVVTWVEALVSRSPSAPDLASAVPPDGFESLPRMLSTHVVTYPDGAGSVTLETMRFAEPIAVADWVATQTYGSELTTDGEITTVTMPGGARYLLWQPRPDLIVPLTGEGDVEGWAGSLRLSTLDEAGPVPVSTNMSGTTPEGLDERAVDRIVLGETTIGRFAYAERSSASGGRCTEWVHERLGGGGECDTPASGASTVPGTPVAGARDSECGITWGIEYGRYVYAFVLDRTDAVIEFRLDDRPVTPTRAETSTATDGTPFTVAWLHDPDATADDQWPGTITVNGLPC